MFASMLALCLTVMPVDTPPPTPKYQFPFLREYPQEQAPHFTPYTVKPVLLNRDEVAKALVRNYPPELREKGLGGTTLLWVFLGKDGWPKDVRVKTSSGYAHMDTAALAVGKLMHFTPALNKEEPVDVWIQLPIVFWISSKPKPF